MGDPDETDAHAERYDDLREAVSAVEAAIENLREEIDGVETAIRNG